MSKDYVDTDSVSVINRAKDAVAQGEMSPKDVALYNELLSVVDDLEARTLTCERMAKFERGRAEEWRQASTEWSSKHALVQAENARLTRVLRAVRAYIRGMGWFSDAKKNEILAQLDEVVKPNG